MPAASQKAPDQVLAESLRLHFQLVQQRGARVIDEVERRQELRGHVLRKKFPCTGCAGEGVLETLTFYGPIGGRPGDLQLGGREVGATGAVRCFVCDGSGVDYQKAGAAQMAALLRVVK